MEEIPPLFITASFLVGSSRGGSKGISCRVFTYPVNSERLSICVALFVSNLLIEDAGHQMCSSRRWVSDFVRHIFPRIMVLSLQCARGRIGALFITSCQCVDCRDAQLVGLAPCEGV